MAEETKKISFGFSKLKKSTVLVKPVEINKPEVDYVDSFDGAKGKFSYKGNVRSDEPVKRELVIPLIGTRTALDVIRSKLEENKINQQKHDDKTKVDDGIEANGTPVGKEEGDKNKELRDTKLQLSIDDLAAKEIINDLHNNSAEEKALNTMVIKQPSKVTVVNEKEAPIDYENIPVNDFGLAMLRGMGWTPETGIGKEQKVVQVVAPKLRPKGLGLGADKVILQQANNDPNLTISLKSYVKFLNGQHKGKYGQVESMDEDNGRVIVKLALGGCVSVSEMLLIPVTKKDYDKNSKVLNVTTYESFKEPEKQSKGKDRSDGDKSSSDSRRKSHDDNHHRKEKYDRREMRDRERVSGDEEDSGKYDRGRARRSSSTSSERKADHKKKKKQTREESADRNYKKTKKKRKKRRNYSSQEESDNSSDRNHDRERSRNYHRSKSKKSSHR